MLRRLVSAVLPALLVGALAPSFLFASPAQAAPQEMSLSTIYDLRLDDPALQTLSAEEAKELIGSLIADIKEAGGPDFQQPMHTPCSSPTLGCLVQLLIHMVEHEVQDLVDLVHHIIKTYGDAICNLVWNGTGQPGQGCTP